MIAKTQIHLVGPEVTVEKRYVRQRCSWCGFLLLDYDLERIQVPEGQGGPRPWKVGGWVEVGEGFAQSVDVNDDAFPNESCVGESVPLLKLVET